MRTAERVLRSDGVRMCELFRRSFAGLGVDVSRDEGGAIAGLAVSRDGGGAIAEGASAAGEARGSEGMGVEKELANSGFASTYRARFPTLS